MKFILSLAVFAAAGVSAVSTTASAASSSSSCDADYIVTQCLETTTDQANDCKTTDYDCLCSAYQAVATCYNNCPNDPRASDAESQVKIYCQNASLYGTRSTVKTQTWHASTTAAEATATDADSEDSTGTATKSAATATNSDNSAADLARNTGGILLAVAVHIWGTCRSLHSLVIHASY
ncbi:hypothetical protein B0T10DRAFT_600317 [Thelonectria olida]|uniref:Gpi anchored serine-threonine rich protein n=1 Tax=Thelonectria olida TaxID=1576542 RepID=A0A9P9AZ70_9HYPO|nr:hypothetical protein B0T10DRAFT_600317 [Thelonectria olida]